MPIAFTNALAQELGDLFEGDQLELEGFTYTLYEESDQTNDLKYVRWDRIYKRNDGRFFVQYCSKSGSYWSDYDYYYGNAVFEVEQVEVKRTEWKVVE